MSSPEGETRPNTHAEGEAYVPGDDRPTTRKNRHRASTRTRVRPGAAPEDERLLEFRGLFHDYLDPQWLPDAVLLRHEHWRTHREEHRLAAGRHLCHPGRALDGRDRVRLPDRRRPLLLVGQAG